VSGEEVITRGKEVIRIEVDTLKALEDRIDSNFAKAVDMIFNSTGRTIVAGMGKSGLVGRKIVATLNSTGTPSFFLHPSDAVHGDLGMVREEDVIIAISKSGSTPEIMQLMPLLQRIGVKIIGMLGNADSPIGKQSDIILDISVKEEACPYDLAPTASTTATMALGDALAIALLHKRNFTKEDFAAFHPGGIIGRQLLLKVEEIMVKGSNVPIVQEQVSLSEAIVEMTSKRLGATCVTNGSGILTGIVTDGDLRRLLQRKTNISDVIVSDLMTHNPKTIRSDTLAATALEYMENYSITQLIVVNPLHHPIGMVHLHDLVKLGL
jgi:arabinose-5-phosphate isomerase